MLRVGMGVRLRGTLATLTGGRAERLAVITLRRTHLIEALQDLLQALDLSLVRFLLHLGVLEDVHDLLHLLKDVLELEGNFPHLFNRLGHGTVPRRGGRLWRGCRLAGNLTRLTLVAGFAMLPVFPVFALVPMASLFTSFPLGRRAEGLASLGPRRGRRTLYGVRARASCTLIRGRVRGLPVRRVRRTFSSHAFRLRSISLIIPCVSILPFDLRGGRINLVRLRSPQTNRRAWDALSPTWSPAATTTATTPTTARGSPLALGPAFG